MSNNFKHSHVHFTQFSSMKARFSHALLLDYILALEKKYAYALRASCFYIEINILNIFKAKYTRKSTIVFHSFLLGACPQPCSKRVDTILYYYFHIKEEHFKMF